MNLITAFGRLIWGCPHPELRRERRDGVLMFACPECGYVKPAISRTPAERAAFRFDRIASERLQAKPSQPASVTPIRKRQA